MKKLMYLMLVVVIAFGAMSLATSPVEAGKGGKGGPPQPDCSEQCPDVGPCVAVACGFDCVYECPFPF